MSTHLTQFFAVDESPDALFDQADRVMDALVELEAEDGSITDGGVSVDAAAGLVTVEVYALGSGSSEEDQQRLLERISLALTRAGIPGTHEIKRELQYA